MDSLPHKCSYSQYGCGHKVKNCHPAVQYGRLRDSFGRFWKVLAA